MKLFIASDIHGSLYYTKKLLDAFDSEQADRLLLLGDLLYHGPRNDLPTDYDPKTVATLLNARADTILAVRGNCDAEVDQAVLAFPILAEYAVLMIDQLTLYATHGHTYHKGHLPPLKKGDLVLHGHTHIPGVEEVGGITLLNPGSVSIPKEQSPHGYMTLENGLFRWVDLDGTCWKEYTA